MPVYLDRRIGGIPQRVLTDDPEELMHIPDEIRKCVAFLGYLSTERFMLIGTTFFLTRPSGIKGQLHGYAITARHVIDGLRDRHIDDIYFRINLKNGSDDWVRCKVSDWILHSDPSVDVAAIRCGIESDMDHFAFTLDAAATADDLKRLHLGIGDEIFVTGLFHLHSGRNKNIPIVRAGNLAALPEEKIITRRFGEMDAYLVELRSIKGLSGSPVFVYFAANDARRIPGNLLNQRRFYLLGLMHGHYDTDDGDIDYIEDSIGGQQQINTGIGIVVPVEKILELINGPIMRKRDLEVEERLKKENASTED